METSKFSNITTSLLQSNAIFDYGTKYYYTNQNKDISNFKFSDKDYQDFKNFIKQSNFNYETSTERSLKNTLEVAKKDKLDQDITESYNALLASIKVSKEKGLDTYKNEIANLLTDEIIKRYSYRQGLYNYYITHNPEIKKSKEILKDKTKYQAILK